MLALKRFFFKIIMPYALAELETKNLYKIIAAIYYVESGEIEYPIFLGQVYGSGF